MSDLHDQFNQARRAYGELAYPGDLAAEALSRQHPANARRMFWQRARRVLAVAACVALMSLTLRMVGSRSHPSGQAQKPAGMGANPALEIHNRPVATTTGTQGVPTRIVTLAVPIAPWMVVTPPLSIDVSSGWSELNEPYRRFGPRLMQQLHQNGWLPTPAKQRMASTTQSAV